MLTGVIYDARWIGNHGIGRFASEIQKQIPGLIPYEERRRPWHPLDPILLAGALIRRKPRLFFSPGYNSPLGWPGPYVFSLHDLHHLCVADNSSLAKRAYYRTIIKPACHRASFVLTVSEYSKHEICTWAKVAEEKVINVGNGVGPPFSSVGAKHEPGYPYLLYVGSHKVHKNLPRLLKAYAISGVHNDVRLLMTGEPGEQMSQNVKALGLENHVAFIGSPNNEQLAEYYRGALALLFPSLYEGFGLPPVEAMACGIPVLTSNICALPEIVGDAGIIVQPLQTDEIADGIRRLVDDPSMILDLRRRGLVRASQFTWEKTGARAFEVLRSAAANGSANSSE